MVVQQLVNRIPLIVLNGIGKRVSGVLVERRQWGWCRFSNRDYYVVNVYRSIVASADAVGHGGRVVATSPSVRGRNRVVRVIPLASSSAASP